MKRRPKLTGEKKPKPGKKPRKHVNREDAYQVPHLKILDEHGKVIAAPIKIDPGMSIVISGLETRVEGVIGYRFRGVVHFLATKPNTPCQIALLPKNSKGLVEPTDFPESVFPDHAGC